MSSRCRPLTLTLLVTAHMLRMTRTSVLSIMSTALYRDGLPEGPDALRASSSRHALPNAAAPIITVVALNLAYLIVGVVVVEIVFVYPGIGQFMVDAVSKRDVPVVQACGLIFAARLHHAQHARRHPRPSSSIRGCGSRGKERDMKLFGHKPPLDRLDRHVHRRVYHPRGDLRRPGSRPMAKSQIRRRHLGSAVRGRCGSAPTISAATCSRA